MAASALLIADFTAYPPQARQLATTYIETLRTTPVIFAALLLREIVGYDWLFPAERAEIEAQLDLLQHPTAELNATLATFEALPLSPELQKYPWAAQPEAFVEKLTAYLWTAHAMDAFRAAATRYGDQLTAIRAHAAPAAPRLCIVLIGRDANAQGLTLFSKLRPHGTVFTNVQTQNGFEPALAVLRARAQAAAAPYKHWYVDGGAAPPIAGKDITTISYDGLKPMRQMLLDTMQHARLSGTVGPEDLRSLMARMRPEQFAAAQTTPDEVLRHFELSLLTEGSGTQIFSTTFVQWAAREILRRARPETLLVRYAPRQADRPMNELLTVANGPEQLDPRGSLVDADMGAYYTWLNLTRLPGEATRFIAWHESGSQAVAISPEMARGGVSPQNCTLPQIFTWCGVDLKA